MVQWNSADSDNIFRHAYDPDKEEAYVIFHHGQRKYTYYGVKAEEYAAFADAPSIKTHFANKVYASGGP